MYIKKYITASHVFLYLWIHFHKCSGLVEYKYMYAINENSQVKYKCVQILLQYTTWLNVLCNWNTALSWNVGSTQRSSLSERRGLELHVGNLQQYICKRAVWAAEQTSSAVRGCMRVSYMRVFGESIRKSDQEMKNSL